MRCVRRRVRWSSYHRKCSAIQWSVIVQQVSDEYDAMAHIDTRAVVIFMVVWEVFDGLLVVWRTFCVVSADLVDEIRIDLIVRRTRVHHGSGCHS